MALVAMKDVVGKGSPVGVEGHRYQENSGIVMGFIRG